MLNKTINFEIDGKKHTLYYEWSLFTRKKRLSVDYVNVPIEKTKSLSSLLVVDQKIMVNGKEIRFVATDYFFDIVVDGEYILCKMPYKPLSIPWWAWVLVVGQLGMAFVLPNAVANAVIYGMGVLNLSILPWKNTAANILRCLCLTVIGWAVYFVVTLVLGSLL